MDRTFTIPLGVVVERRKIDHPWAEWSWRPVAVLPGAPPVDEWVELEKGDGWTRFHCGTATLTLYRTDTEAYRISLAEETPRVWVILRRDEEGGDARPYTLAAVTASPYEAQDYLDSGEELVEAVPMPVGLVAMVERFVDAHHVDEPFKKRRRDRLDPEEPRFGKEPIFAKSRGAGGRGRGDE